MRDSKEIETMRHMEWEKVKGRLRAILASYWNMSRDKYKEIEESAEDFILEFGEIAGLD